MAELQRIGRRLEQRIILLHLRKGIYTNLSGTDDVKKQLKEARERRRDWDSYKGQIGKALRTEDYEAWISILRYILKRDTDEYAKRLKVLGSWKPGSTWETKGIRKDEKCSVPMEPGDCLYFTDTIDQRPHVSGCCVARRPKGALHWKWKGEGSCHTPENLAKVYNSYWKAHKAGEVSDAGDSFSGDLQWISPKFTDVLKPFYPGSAQNKGVTVKDAVGSAWQNVAQGNDYNCINSLTGHLDHDHPGREWSEILATLNNEALRDEHTSYNGRELTPKGRRKVSEMAEVAWDRIPELDPDSLAQRRAAGLNEFWEKVADKIMARLNTDAKRTGGDSAEFNNIVDHYLSATAVRPDLAELRTRLWPRMVRESARLHTTRREQ